MSHATKSPLPMSYDELRTLVGQFPRVRLANLPTPLQECPRLAAALGGPRIFIKRDDLTGLAFGGNKTRNLEFRMAEALDQGADVFIAGLEAQSNSARQTTAAANILGMQTVLILRVDRDWQWQGNMLVDRILGAEVRFLESDDPADMDAALRKAAEECHARGRKTYVMNHASRFATGSALAYILSSLETLEQLGAQGLKPTHVYMCSGSKGQAGLELAKRLTGSDFKVIGMSARASANRLEEIAGTASETAERLGVALKVAASEIVNHDEYAEPGYGKISERCLEAMRLLARTEGVLLDPVYTGKAMAGLIDHVRRGLLGKDDIVVFVHTGGLPAMFAYKDEILSYLDEVDGRG